MEILLAGAGILGVVALRDDIANALKQAGLKGEKDNISRVTDKFPIDAGMNAAYRLSNESGQRNFPTSLYDHVATVDTDTVTQISEPYLKTLQDPRFVKAYAYNYADAWNNLRHPLLEAHFRRNPYNMFRQRVTVLGSPDDQNILGWNL